MSWRLFARILRVSFLLRVPLGTFLVLILLGPIARYSGLRSLLSNLLDMQNDSRQALGNTFEVSLAAFILALTAITTLNLVFYYGHLRLDPNLPARGGNPHPFLTFTIGAVSAWVLIGFVIARTERANHFLLTLSAFAAMLVAVVLTLLAKVVQLTFTDPEVTPHPPPYLVLPVDKIPALKNWFMSLYDWPGKNDSGWLARAVRHSKSGTNRVFQWPLEIVEMAAQGYLDRVSTLGPGERLKLKSGHVFALSLFILAFLIYFLGGLLLHRITDKPPLVPALAYVLLFLINACWALSFFTFFLDRYRFPLLTFVLLISSLTWSVPESDHIFRVERQDEIQRSIERMHFLTPAAYVQQRFGGPEPSPLIVIATPGGGIQAAAWTGEVLQRLSEMFPDGSARGFRHSVGLISSVSGGSLGSMVFAASYTGNIPLSEVARNARRGAIDEVAWGWVNPDFWRTIIPLFRLDRRTDRGWALEEKWAAVNNLKPQGCVDRKSPACGIYLSDWARRRDLPALIFNSTIVETGHHVVFSTTRYPGYPDPRGIHNFYDLFDNQGANPVDIRVNTAARLSASFPYVAPASRASIGSPQVGSFHFVDGGYYDNLGIDSLVGWLAAAFPHRREGETARSAMSGSPKPRVLILEIRHFNPDAEQTPARQGWLFQTTAPPVGLLSVWSNSPTDRDRNELNDFITSSTNLDITHVVVPYCGLNYLAHTSEEDSLRKFTECMRDSGGGPVSGSLDLRTNRNRDCSQQPLSWKLSDSQQQCVSDTWKIYRQAGLSNSDGSLCSIAHFLGQESRYPACRK